MPPPIDGCYARPILATPCSSRMFQKMLLPSGPTLPSRFIVAAKGPAASPAVPPQRRISSTGTRPPIAEDELHRPPPPPMPLGFSRRAKLWTPSASLKKRTGICGTAEKPASASICTVSITASALSPSVHATCTVGRGFRPLLQRKVDEEVLGHPRRYLEGKVLERPRHGLCQIIRAARGAEYRRATATAAVVGGV